METSNQTLKQHVIRIQSGVLAFVLAVICGLGLFIMTVWLVLKGGDVVGPHLQLLEQYFIGYSVTWPGAFVGLVYGALVGGFAGWIIGTIYNKAVLWRSRS